MLWVTSYYFLYRAQHKSSFDKITELSWSHNQVVLLSSISSWSSYISASSWCLDTSVICRYLSGNIFHGLFSGIQILQWTVEDIATNYWWVVVPLTLGMTRNQSSSSTWVTLHIQESKVKWSPWCIQNWIPFYYRQQKRQLKKTKIVFLRTATELL